MIFSKNKCLHIRKTSSGHITLLVSFYFYLSFFPIIQQHLQRDLPIHSEAGTFYGITRALPEVLGDCPSLQFLLDEGLE